jgi:hypothetical protein
MDKLQNDNGFYYHWDLQFDLKSENTLTINTSCTEPCMMPPLEYFQFPFNSNDGSSSLFYYPVSPSPTSASVDSVLSSSFDIPSQVTGPQIMLIPSPDCLSFSSHESFFDPLAFMNADLRSWSPSDMYNACRPESKEHASDQEMKTKRIVMCAKEPKHKLNLRTLKPFECKVCRRPFARKHDLQRHVRVHTGVKPYACLHCKKSFIRTDALKHHLRAVEACRTSPIIQAMKESGDRRYRNLWDLYIMYWIILSCPFLSSMSVYYMVDPGYTLIAVLILVLNEIPYILIVFPYPFSHFLLKLCCIIVYFYLKQTNHFLSFFYACFFICLFL